MYVWYIKTRNNIATNIKKVVKNKTSIYTWLDIKILKESKIIFSDSFRTNG